MVSVDLQNEPGRAGMQRDILFLGLVVVWLRRFGIAGRLRGEPGTGAAQAFDGRFSDLSAVILSSCSFEEGRRNRLPRHRFSGPLWVVTDPQYRTEFGVPVQFRSRTCDSADQKTQPPSRWFGIRSVSVFAYG